jgi:hypothetical protein
MEFSTTLCRKSTLAMLESILTCFARNLQSKIYGCYGQNDGRRIVVVEFLWQIDGVFCTSMPRIDPSHARVDSDMFCNESAMQSFPLGACRNLCFHGKLMDFMTDRCVESTRARIGGVFVELPTPLGTIQGHAK